MGLGEGDRGQHRHAGGHEADGEAPRVGGAIRHLVLGAQHEDDGGHLPEKTCSWGQRGEKSDYNEKEKLLFGKLPGKVKRCALDDSSNLLVHTVASEGRGYSLQLHSIRKPNQQQTQHDLSQNNTRHT